MPRSSLVPVSKESQLYVHNQSDKVGRVKGQNFKTPFYQQYHTIHFMTIMNIYYKTFVDTKTIKYTRIFIYIDEWKKPS